MDYVDINNYSVSFFYLTLQRFMQLVTSPIIYYDETNDTEQYYEIIYIMLYTTQYPVEFLVKYLTSPIYLEIFESLSEGTTNRRTLKKEIFININLTDDIIDIIDKNRIFMKKYKPFEELKLDLELKEKELQNIIY